MTKIIEPKSFDTVNLLCWPFKLEKAMMLLLCFELIVTGFITIASVILIVLALFSDEKRKYPLNGKNEIDEISKFEVRLVQIAETIQKILSSVVGWCLYPLASQQDFA